MKKKRNKWRDNITGYLFLLPNISGFLIFTFVPVLASLALCFTEWDIIKTPVYIGLNNFIQLLGFHSEVGVGLVPNDPLFWKYLVNTLFFMLGIPVGMSIALMLALAMNQRLKGIVFFRTIYFMPVISSMVAIALLWRWLYNPDFGLFNTILNWFGIRGPNWLSDTAWSKPSIMIMGWWKGAGYSMLLYLAGLQGISEEYYEASRIDGANKWQQFWHITFPLLSPVHFFMLIMGAIHGFQIFGEAYVMTSGGPAGSTTTIAYYIYNNAFQWFKMGYASAVAWVLFLMAFTVTIFQWKFLGKRIHYE